MLLSPPGVFPTELLSHIFSRVSEGDLAPLARCNRLFYQLCNPLLYRDMYIHTPRQLARLPREESIRRFLRNTESMFIDDWALSSEGWCGIEDVFPGARIIECLVNVWKATPALRWLQVCRSDLSCAHVTADASPLKLDDRDEEILNKAANDPTFLPQLAFMLFYKRGQSRMWFFDADPFMVLTNSRPVIYSSITGDALMVVEIYCEPQARGSESNSALAPPSREGSNWSASGYKAIEFIESSLHVSPQWRASPRILMVSFYDFGDSLGTQDVYPWVGDFLAELRPPTSLPSLSSLAFQFNDLMVPDELFKFGGQGSFFELIDRVSPGLSNVSLKFGPSVLWVRWFKLSLASEERRAYPNFPRWAPEFISFLKDDIYSWWIESLNLDAGIIGVPDHNAIQSMALELNQAFRLAYRDDALSQGLIVRNLLEYYES